MIIRRNAYSGGNSSEMYTESKDHCDTDAYQASDGNREVKESVYYSCSTREVMMFVW